MMVNMLVKIWLYLTKAVITGDVDEVRVQSEEPNLKSLLLKQAFCFCAFWKTAGWRLRLTRLTPSGNNPLLSSFFLCLDFRLAESP
ncbi:hypothetical protein ACUYFS_16030 [Enterobacter cloacae]